MRNKGLMRNRVLRAVVVWLSVQGLLPAAQAQVTASVKPVEVFCGADLGYADTNWLRLYDVLLTLTPGVKWHMGHDWQMAVQGVLPIVREGYTYDAERYGYMRLNLAAISRQLHFDSERQHLKLSAGLFGSGRWGADLKWMMPVSEWLLLQAQAGCTGAWRLGCNLHGRSENNFDSRWVGTFMAGANVFVKRFNTEVRGSGGRFVNEDYGLQLDVVSHFRHCSVDLFYQLRLGERLASSVDTYTDRSNGGFRVIVMLPPYGNQKRLTAGDVEFRPASNFRLTNNVRSDGRSMQGYITDPEENERQLSVDVDWGINGSEGLNEK